MNKLGKLTLLEEKNLYRHLCNYMVFQDEITTNNFFNEFKRTFNSICMTHGDCCVFRKRLYKK